jgi:tetratricopeptide (TPR) repeat protein
MFPFAAAICAIALLAPGLAWGNDNAAERTKGARTVVGAPDSAQCALAAANQTNDDDAVQACDRALTTERLSRPNRIATLINRGAIHLRRREGEAALSDFDAVVALAPRNAEAHLNRGAALVLVNRPGPGVAAITTALSFGVSAPHKAYFNRAAAREAMGDVRGAFEDYNTALTIQPDWGVAEAELARFARGRRERLASQLDGSSGSQ